MTGSPPLFDPFKALAEIRREMAAEPASELSQKLSQHPAKENAETNQNVDPTFATFAAFADAPSAHDLARARVKEEERKNNSIKSYTYARDEHARTVAPEHGRIDPAKAAKTAKVSLSYSDHAGSPEMGPAKVLEDGLRKWHSALATLSADRIPCPGYRPEEWARTLARALEFLDVFGSQAEAMGWTSPRLFGVHPTVGIVRVDHCGGLVLPSAGAVRAISATEISFGHLTHREKPGQPQGVPIWEFGR